MSTVILKQAFHLLPLSRGRCFILARALGVKTCVNFIQVDQGFNGSRLSCGVTHRTVATSELHSDKDVKEEEQPLLKADGGCSVGERPRYPAAFHFQVRWFLDGVTATAGANLCGYFIIWSLLLSDLTELPLRSLHIHLHCITR